jgi:hypothetical protein
MRRHASVLALCCAFAAPAPAQQWGPPMVPFGAASGGGSGGTPGGTVGQVQFNSAGSFGGFTMSGDCTLVTSTGVVTCASLGGKAITLGGPLATTGAGTTTLAFGAAGNTYTFPNSSDTVVTLAATQTLVNKSIVGSEVNSGTVPLAQMPSIIGFPPYVTGASAWYPNPYMTSVPTTSGTGVTNSYYCAPFWINGTVTIKGLAIRVVATSTGNSSAALEGALYNDIISTSGTGIHQPGVFIDYTTDFATGSATTVAATMHNTTDTLTGPGMYWECVQRFDAVATYVAFNASSAGILPAILGGTGGAPLGATQISGVFVAGSAYGTINWVNFPASTTWSQASGQNAGPYMAIEVN